MLLLAFAALACCAAPVVVVVFTRDRATSLGRLIASINASQPLSMPIDLHFCVDVASSNAADRATLALLDALRWRRGTVTRRVWPKPAHIVGQWLGCWEENWRDTALLEDDLELAPYALAWLADARQRHAHDHSIIGFSFQRQTNCFHAMCKASTLKLPWSLPEYKYLLVGSWGYAPVSDYWNAFRRWYYAVRAENASYVPNVPRLKPSDWYKQFVRDHREHTMWTMWFIEFCDKRRLYTLYYNHPTPLTLSAHWAERGAHFSGASPHRDHELVGYDVTARQFPQSVPQLDWDGVVQADSLQRDQIIGIAQQAREIMDTGRVPLLTFVSDGFRNMTAHFICNLATVAPHLLSQTIFVAVDAAMYERLSVERAHRNYVVASLGLPDVVANEPLLYGTVRYFLLMLARTEALLEIMEHRVPFLLFECDAAVRNDFVAAFVEAARANAADIVGIQDNMSWSNKNPNGGFMLFAESNGTRELWRNVTTRFAANMAPHRNSTPTKNIGIQHDQDILTALLKVPSIESKVSVHIMDRQRYVSGYVFGRANGTAIVAGASVVLFNFVIGIAAKHQRAVSSHLWFLNDTSGACVDPRPRPASTTCKLTRFGGRPGDGAWTLCSNLLGSKPIVWSFGVGPDISFELDILKTASLARVSSFDPTVEAAAFDRLCAAAKGRCSTFYPIGLAAVSGNVTFYKSRDPKISSLAPIAVAGYENKGFVARVATLADLMNEHHIAKLDVLKIDIEGGEFDLVASWRTLPTTQLAIEVHDRFVRNGTARRQALFEQLNRLGFSQMHATREEFLFVRQK